MKKLKIACVGGKHTHYQDFSKMLMENEKCELVGVWDDDSEKMARWARNTGTAALNSYESILENPAIDGVLITATPYQHEEYIIAAAKAGKHVCVEQPLAVSVDAAYRIREAVKSSGIHFTMANPVKKGVPALAKNLADKGVIGDILNVRMRTLHDNTTLLLVGKFPDFAYVYDKNQSGGGAMNNMGCHGVKVLRWFLGMPISCFGMYTALTHIGEENHIDENAVTVYKFANGAIGTIETGWVHPRFQAGFECNGTEGSVIAVPDGAIYRTKDSEWIHVDSSELPGIAEHPLACWINNILENRTDDEYNIDEAVDLTIMINAAYDSQGREIKISGSNL